MFPAHTQRYQTVPLPVFLLPVDLHQWISFFYKFLKLISPFSEKIFLSLIFLFNNSYTQTALSVTNFAMFSLKIFQHQMAFFTKCNSFGQTLFFLPLRKAHLYKSCLHFFFLGYHEQLERIVSSQLFLLYFQFICKLLVFCSSSFEVWQHLKEVAATGVH